MQTCLRNILDLALQKGQVSVTWLGQAGYVIKACPDIYLVIDPYLSDICEQNLGRQFKRLMPAVLTVEELNQLPLAAYLITHHHEDHLDPPIIQALQGGDYPFLAPPDSVSILRGLNVASDRCLPLAQDARVVRKGFTVTGTFADHGELAPDAVGIIIETAGKVIYHMGDTCLNEAELQKLRDKWPSIDLLIVPINGKYGNMNEAEAIKAIGILQPKHVLPCHFWMLPANSGGDVAWFCEHAAAACPDVEVRLLTQGDRFILESF
ncbi:MBL fold metallo-hydrolase [Cohnella ginsengisoli]|uniref:MBL fold metallo-hydrolase n=1 Tax=Cohnella ginsengisoli TaxID=425004 RepID=A0A9X4KGG1_9BACL|nr:MBL fold metallo-hydrolase [Cohnella ginsengisoli]MDG0791296.1 MBL fold metallo-hydrolase [Cohnella ginsengisoli]